MILVDPIGSPALSTSVFRFGSGCSAVICQQSVALADDSPERRILCPANARLIPWGGGPIACARALLWESVISWSPTAETGAMVGI
jgi:hypothetical protein